MTLRKGDAGEVSEASVAAWRGGGEPLLLHQQLVGKRLYVNVQVRFLVAGGIAGGALFAKHALGIAGLDAGALLLLAAVLALFNVGVFLMVRRHRNLEQRRAVCRWLMGIMHLSISVDFVFLTVALWLVGGAKSPLMAFYLIHVILAAALLTPPAACAHAVFGYVLLSGLVLGEWGGLIPIHMPVGLINSAHPLDGRYVLTVLASQALLMFLGLYMLAGLTKLLRRGERQLRTANAELEHLSSLQRDFLHIALHDLKSPVNASLMLLESMKIDSTPPLTSEQAQWVERIRLKLTGATAFLRDLGVLAALESGSAKEQAKEIDLRSFIEGVVAEHQDAAAARKQTLTVEIEDALPSVRGVELLLHEMVVNLITNANKYTPEGGSIRVCVGRRGNKARIEVKDTGIGIAPEDQSRLFQQFVRIARRHEALGDVSGSGMGLYIVRRIAALHGGEAGVSSVVDQGSTFYVEIPFCKRDAQRPPDLSA